MKTLSTITFICVFQFIGMAQSQEWRPVRTDGIYMFDIGQEYRALRIDSTHLDSDTVHLFGFHEINYHEDTWCYNPKGAPWFGKEVINYPDCTVIKNRFNESLIFPLVQKAPWIFFAQGTDTVRAYLSEEKEYSFLGIVDSIRIIQLDDGTDQQIPPEIWLSKNYGMIKTYNLSMYRHSIVEDYSDKFYDFNFEAVIAGIGKDNVGVLNFSTKEVFDFEIGDEFHISDYSKYFFSSEYFSNRTIKKVIGKELAGNNYQYTFQQCQGLGVDTIVEEYQTTSILDSLPGQSIVFDEDMLVNFSRKGWNGLPAYYFNLPIFKRDDDCYEPLITKTANSKLISPYGYYLKGLGGAYYFYDNGEYVSSEELVYYKKGSTEWGTPYVCDSLIGINDDIQNTQVWVYPNPVTEFIQINFTLNPNEAVLLVLDVLGQELLRVSLTELNNSVSLSKLPMGMLFYQILESGKPVKKGNFVRQ